MRTKYVAAPLLAALFFIAGCEPTPGGNSKSLNRRHSGTVSTAEIASCDVGALGITYGTKDCTTPCDTGRVSCTYKICVDLQYCFGDATRAEYLACKPNRRWPDCRPGQAPAPGRKLTQ